MLNIRGYFYFDPSLKNELSLNFSFWFDSKSWGTVISYFFLTITPNWKYLHKLSHLYVETELILADVENLFLFYARECKNAAQRNYWMSEKNFSWQLQCYNFCTCKVSWNCLHNFNLSGDLWVGKFASVSFLSKQICL